MLFNNLLDKIYEKDYEFQEEILTEMAKLRKMPSPKIFLKNKMFFCPHDNYVLDIAGSYLKDEALGLFRGDNCLGLFKLWIPIYDFADNVVGFNWYSDGSVEKELNKRHIKYQFQVGTFIKSRYLNIRPDEYKRAVDLGYICIVDGFMDKYHLEYYDEPSTSTYGSTLDIYKTTYLSPIKHHIVFMDNDEAGIKLAKLVVANGVANGHIVTVVKQPCGSDVDDYLKAHREHPAMLKSAIANLVSGGAICSEIELKSLLHLA